MPDKIAETKRLILRNLCPADAEIIFDYRNNEVCYRYQRWDDVSLEAVSAFVNQYQTDEFLSQKEEQHYAVCLKDGRLIGDISYFYSQKDTCITLGITISYEHHKMGYAAEILTKVIEEIRRTYLELDIVALIDKDNAASIRLFEKLGFVQECYAEKIASYVYVIYGDR